MQDFEGDVQKLFRFCSEIRTVDSVFPAQSLHVLLAVALKPGSTQSDLRRATRLTASSISRNVNALSVVNRKGEPGYGLVASVPSRTSTIGFDIYLTAKGRDLMRRLLTAATGRRADRFEPPTAR